MRQILRELKRIKQLVEGEHDDAYEDLVVELEDELLDELESDDQ